MICAALAGCLVSGPDDPKYGEPGAIGKQNFPGEQGTSSGAPAGDGGVTGGNIAPFPAPYSATSPSAATPDPTSPAHKTAANVLLTHDLACMACHGQASTTATEKWMIGGFVAATPGGDDPLASGEVIVVDGTNVLAHVKTSSDGYFWAPGSDALPMTAKVAIRNKDGKISKMTSSLGGSGNCMASGTCHGGSAGKIDFK
jgi:hypothetical protein